jgi:hypothetical protein
VDQGQQQQGSLAGWGSERCSRSRTQDDQIHPVGSTFLTDRTAPAVGLPVLAPEAVALAQQQLASGSISLPSPRSSRLRGGARTSCSPRSAAGAAVSVVAVTLTAEAAVNSADNTGRREFGSAALWLRRSKLQSVAVAAAAQSFAGRSSIGGGQPLGAIPASCPGPGSATPCDIRVSQLFSTYVGAPAGRQSVAPAVQGQITPRLWAAGATSSTTLQQPGTGIPRDAAAEPPAGRDISLNGQGGGCSSSGVRAVTADAVSVGHCSPARPMPGGVFVELDGPAWDAAESATDAASWCLTSRSSRNSRKEPAQQQAAASLQQREELPPQHLTEQGVAAAVAAPLSSRKLRASQEPAGGLRDASALITAARQLLEQPLPPGSIGSGCRPVSSFARPLTDASVPQQDGLAGLHCDQRPCGTAPQPQQSVPEAPPASLGTATAGSRSPAGPASSRSLGPGRSSARPGTVPKLQLATLHLSLQAGTEVCTSPISDHQQRCSTAAAGPTPSGSWQPGSPKLGVGTAAPGCISSPHQLDQNKSALQEAALLPPVLPAFTPRRKWAPGGSRSSSGGGGAVL